MASFSIEKGIKTLQLLILDNIGNTGHSICKESNPALTDLHYRIKGKGLNGFQMALRIA